MTRRLSATGSVLDEFSAGKLFGFGNHSFLVSHAQRIDAEYDGQVAGDGQHSGNIVVRLAEKMVAGKTGNHYGNQQEYRYQRFHNFIF
jgi:hypothetical protein